jgi:hypothetical protein
LVLVKSEYLQRIGHPGFCKGHTSCDRMKGFISYSHEDHRMFRELRKHLTAIERGLPIKFWADTRINAGDYWSTTIEAAIQSADVFVLLTTPAFIASDYIYYKEIPAIRKRHRSSNALVLPVVLERCCWQMVADVLQAVPTENGSIVPIADWKPKKNGLDRARAQVAISIEFHFGITAKTLRWSAR